MHLVFLTGDMKHWNYKCPTIDTMMTQETVFNNANTRAEAILQVLQTLGSGELLNPGQQLLKITDVLRMP